MMGPRTICDECEWNYIVHNDGVAGSSPALGTIDAGVAQKVEHGKRFIHFVVTLLF